MECKWEGQKKKKSNTGDCESYMGNWIFCGRDPNPSERSNNIWEKDSSEKSESAPWKVLLSTE